MQSLAKGVGSEEGNRKFSGNPVRVGRCLRLSELRVPPEGRGERLGQSGCSCRAGQRLLRNHRWLPAPGPTQLSDGKECRRALGNIPKSQ